MVEDKLTEAPPNLVAPSRTTDAAGVMTLFVMIVATLYFGRAVLLPVTMALLLAFILAPLVDLLGRARLGRIPAVLLAVVLALGVILSIGGVIGTQVAQLTTNLPSYAAAVEIKISLVRGYTVERISHFADALDGRGPQSHPQAARASALGQPAVPAALAAEPLADTPMVLAERYLTPVLSPLATIGIVFIVAVFALVQREDLRDRLIWLAGSNDLGRTSLAIDEGGRRLSRYFLSQVSINSGFGVCVGIGLLLIGVPNPVLWGILSGLLRFVPYVGSLVSALLPMMLAAAVEPGWAMMVWTLGLYLVLEALTGQVIEPVVYGHSTGLSPFSVIVAAIFWSWVWGPVGLILSTPLTLCLVVVGRHVSRLKFLDVMLGDHPPLTEAASFYQGLLDGGTDELKSRSKVILRSFTFLDYCDRAVLRGLQLAALDSDRGVLDRAQLLRLKTTFEALANYWDIHVEPEALAVPPDRHQAPDGPPSQVLCIAGPGAVDALAATLLLQLLKRQGFLGRLISYEDAMHGDGKPSILCGVELACVCHLDNMASVSKLRDLVRRLHERLPPGTSLVLGFGPPTKDAAAALPPDTDYVRCFADAITACRRLAADA